jgi:hypothetical protein
VTRHAKGNDFSRIKPSSPERPTPGGAPQDHEGRRALFTPGSAAPTVAGTGSVTITCSSCGESSVLAPAAAVKYALPSLHIPYLKRDHGSWMRCPSCRQHHWVSVHIQLP